MIIKAIRCDETIIFKRIPHGKLTLWHHLSSVFFSRTQTQVLRWVERMARVPNWPNHENKDQLGPVNIGIIDTMSIGTQQERLKTFQRNKMDMWLHISTTSSAVGRSLGSNARRRSSRRRASGSALGNLCLKGTGCFFRMLLRYLLAFSFRICQLWKKIF